MGTVRKDREVEEKKILEQIEEIDHLMAEIELLKDRNCELYAENNYFKGKCEVYENTINFFILRQK